ncbi:MAG TPA: hypothetical protein DD706_16150 [Nitrospiraceae bacterium]|nr:hypothetical protein [Nitrospiraceae bacterium]
MSRSLKVKKGGYLRLQVKGVRFLCKLFGLSKGKIKYKKRKTRKIDGRLNRDALRLHAVIELEGLTGPPPRLERSAGAFLPCRL